MGSFVIADNAILQVEDLRHDQRFAGNAEFRSVGVRFYAAAPIRDKGGLPIGVLSLLDAQPRELGERELRLLQAMANEIMQEWKGIELPEPEAPAQPEASATLGQTVPT